VNPRQESLVKPDRIIVPSADSTPLVLLVGLGFTISATHSSMDDGFGVEHFKLMFSLWNIIYFVRWVTCL